MNAKLNKKEYGEKVDIIKELSERIIKMLEYGTITVEEREKTFNKLCKIQRRY